MGDGLVIFTELRGRSVRRPHPDGIISTVAEPHGSPNGAALGPDGSLYVFNNGGVKFSEVRGH